MSVDVELAGRIVDFLNELLAIDGKVVRDLVQTRVPCSQELANHPTVQVGRESDDIISVGGLPYRVGLLGILNGLCGTYDDGPKKGWGAIAVIFTDEQLEKIDCFKVMGNKL